MKQVVEQRAKAGKNLNFITFLVICYWSEILKYVRTISFIYHAVQISPFSTSGVNHPFVWWGSWNLGSPFGQPQFQLPPTFQPRAQYILPAPMVRVKPVKGREKRSNKERFVAPRVAQEENMGLQTELVGGKAQGNLQGRLQR